MAPQIKNTLAFNLLAGASVVLPHGLNDGNKPLAPDTIFVPNEDLVVTASTTASITVQNTSPDPMAGNILVEAWHTIERAFGGVQNVDLPVKPYIVTGGGDGSSNHPGNNFVFRPGGTAGDNVYTDWATLVAALPTVQGFKTIQFDDSIVTPIEIPAGVWDMTRVEWMGVPRLVPGPSAQQLGADVLLLDGSSFPNLRQIGGDLQIENGNTVNAPIVIPATGALIEIGESASGVFTEIINAGAAPFIDATALVTTTNGGQLVLRLRGSIRGFSTASPAIQFGTVLTGVRGQFSLSDGASLAAGMIGGGVAGQIVRVLTTGSGSGIGGQQVTYLGSIDHLRPSNGATAVGLLRRFFVPVDGTTGALLPPSTTPISTTNGLGMNSVLRFNTTAGDIAQTLPLIRAAAPAIGAGINTAGVLDSTSLIVTVKNAIGTNDVIVTGSAVTPDSIDGGFAAVVVPPGGSRTFMSDGVSNWIALETPPPSLYSPPEQWGQDNVVANQVDVELTSQVSANFNTIRMMRSGSLIGLNARLTEAITAGTLTVEVTINGAPATMALVMITPALSAHVTQNAGIDTYAAGDFIGVQISTDAGFLPVTTDLETWIELAEVI